MRISINFIRLPLLACAAALALGSPAAVAGPEDNSLVFGQRLSITDIGPAFNAFLQYPSGYEAAFVIFDRLVTFDDQLRFNPQLAESWTIAEDQKSVTFKLRAGATFHDGTPINAEAVKFNIERMMDPEINTTNRPLWDPIAGADVVDDLTVTLRTHEPYALLLNTLAHGSGAILSPTAIMENGQESETQNPVGSGPYKVASFDPGLELVLEPHEGHWAGKPALDRIVFRYIPEASTRVSALQSGDVDVIDGVPTHLISQIEATDGLQILAAPSLRPMGIAMQTTIPPLDNVEVRRALNHAVPVDAIAEKLFLGQAKASDSPLAFNTVGYHGNSPYAHDPDKAREMLAAAGLSDGDGNGMLEFDGQDVSFTLLVPEGVFANDVLIAETVAAALQDVGIGIEIRKIERSSFWDTLRLPVADAGWQLGMFGFNPSNASGLYHLDSMYSSNPDNSDRPAVWNITRYSNARVDELIDQATVTVDGEARAAILAEVQEHIWSEAPYVWLQVNNIISASRADLGGVEVWPVIFTIVRGGAY
ncbi:MAG: ABC transporter substrate-binding protein [Rhodobacteraceae bacterium]|nr:ABC transporter substrate-binding protein [Paracoccaceae bacterium]